MARKTAIDKLADAVNGILKEYQNDIQENMEAITQKMGQKGAQALRQSSKESLTQHTGEYAKGWKYDFRKTKRMSTGTTTIYNEHHSMPHLLEHSHVIRNGTGRVYGEVTGRPHIAPVAEKLEEAFEKEVLDKL